MRDVASRLRGVFKNSLLSVLTASGSVGLGGCGDDGFPPGIEDDPGFVPVACLGDSQQWLAGLTPEIPTEYMELRTSVFGGASQVVETSGTLCGGAADATACETEFAGLSSDQRFTLGRCVQGCVNAQLAATQGQAALLVESTAELISFLGSIDTPSEAMFIVHTTGLNVSCIRGGAKPQGDGFDVQAFSYQGCDGRTRHVQHVAATGDVSSVDSVVERKPDPNCVVGRRPLGLIPAPGCAAAGPLGRYWADAARLEAASIAAFRRLRRELHLHGAPRRLLEASRRAARDEVRHTRVVRSLARACGATPEPVRLASLPLRDLEAIAIENAVEGCVRETYGALVGLWQARCAGHATVRAAYARIAEDELRHAALAWRVAAWTEKRLSTEARARVRKARDGAIAELLRELEIQPDPELSVVAGVPMPKNAIALADQLRRSIWS